MNNQELIKEYGTPFYHFDISELKKRIEMMRGHQSDIGLCYAMKAGPYLAKYAAPYVDRLEVCSPGEYEICVRDGITPGQILVSGVNKTEESMRRILSLGGAEGLFSIESVRHFEILEEVARECADSETFHLKCYIRLSSGNQFGVDKSLMDELIDRVNKSQYLEFLGIHYFSGTQKTVKKIEMELTELAAYGLELEERLGAKISLEYGPGLGIDYFGNDSDASATVDASYNEDYLIELMKLVDETGLRDSYSDITFEYGRYIAATCGRYFTSVVDVKRNAESNFAILDGGLHQITYYGGMAGMKVPPIDHIAQKRADDKSSREDYVLAGSLCSVNDILVRRVTLPTLDIGDILCFNLAGAYSATEGIALFLSRDLPAIVIRDEEGTEILAREHIETNIYNGGYNG